MERIHASPRRVVTREKKGRTEELDVIPSILRIAAGDGEEIDLVLRVGGAGAARPDDVVRALYGGEAGAVRIVRKELLVLRGTEPLSPMECRGPAKLAPATVPAPS